MIDELVGLIMALDLIDLMRCMYLLVLFLFLPSFLPSFLFSFFLSFFLSFLSSFLSHIYQFIHSSGYCDFGWLLFVTQGTLGRELGVLNRSRCIHFVSIIVVVVIFCSLICLFWEWAWFGVVVLRRVPISISDIQDCDLY